MTYWVWASDAEGVVDEIFAENWYASKQNAIDAKSNLSEHYGGAKLFKAVVTQEEE
jgi:hypothetical protein